MTLRSLLFWSHLVSGVVAGSIILIMSATGVLLTYEKQMVAWADRSARVVATVGTARLPMSELAARVRASHDGGALTAIVMPRAADAPALVTVRQTAWLVDPYSGATIGESAPRLRRFFRAVTEWHRYLAVSGSGRPNARAVTGWANFLFLFMVMSGAYLWWPRQWSARHVKAVTLFNSRLAGRARDFNWHNTIGFWCCVPLFFVVISAMPISFPWANALVYRLAGEKPPAQAAPRPPTTAPQRTGEANTFAGLDAAWARAGEQVADWRTITLRLPAEPRAPLVFTIDRGGAGQPQYRGTFTADRATGEAIRWEPFEAQSPGRRIRSISRFLHTGEVLGIAGQTIAGVASLGAVVLVWTGLALSYRRFFSRSRARQQRDAAAA